MVSSLYDQTSYQIMSDFRDTSNYLLRPMCAVWVSQILCHCWFTLVNWSTGSWFVIAVCAKCWGSITGSKSKASVKEIELRINIPRWGMAWFSTISFQNENFIVLLRLTFWNFEKIQIIRCQYLRYSYNLLHSPIEKCFVEM